MKMYYYEYFIVVNVIGLRWVLLYDKWAHQINKLEKNNDVGSLIVSNKLSKAV